jgi:hypothetical protein
VAERFVDIEFDTDPQSLADDAVDRLRDEWEGYEPNDGDLEVVLLEAVSPMAADAAEAAGQVPAAIFREFGTKLIGLPYSEGAPAQADLTFELVDDWWLNPLLDGTVPEGTSVLIDGYEFVTDTEETAANETTTVAAVRASAVDNGTAQNGLLGASVVPLISLANVADVSLDAPTSGGEDEDDDDDYQDRLSQWLELSGWTLVTERDYEIMALLQNGIGRAVARHNGARDVVVTVTDDDGEPVDTAAKDALEELYAEYHLVNTVVTITDPDYTEVDVTYEVKLYPGFVAADVLARIDEQLASWLSPAEWGRPKLVDADDAPGWVNETVVRKNKLIDLIGDVEGVDYVDDVTIASTAATLTTALSGTNNDLTYTADTAGAAGNSIRVRYVVAGTGTALSVSVSTNDITVNVATDGSGNPTSTAAQVKTAVDASGAAAALVNTANATGNDGTGVVAAMGYTNLSGGAGPVDAGGNLTLVGDVPLSMPGTMTGSTV